jgi:hypothetical protein
VILPAHNAHLTGVYQRGTPADFDEAEGTATKRWEGDCEAYVSERNYENVIGGELNVVTETVLRVPGNVPADVQPDDIVTYIPTGGEATTRRVRQVEALQIGVLRLHLWNT